tara:strand:- start:1079 stop:1435 length:357 start_codon:yes stop_codon:yes gene_type:complete
MKKTKTSKKRFEDREHLESIARMQCIMRSFHTGCECKGPTQAHHLLKPYDGSRGIGLRANDKNVIPLCYHHHHELHTKYGSEKEFFNAYGLPDDTGKRIAEMLYNKRVPIKIIDNSPF